MSKVNNVKELVSLNGEFVVLVLCALWFAFWTYALRWYVPVQVTGENYESYRILFAAFTAACMTGVFWFAANMFLVVYADQKKRAKQG